MVKLSSLRIDTVAVEQGRSFEFTKGLGLTFRVARAGNARFLSRLEELTVPHLPEIDAKTFSEKDREALRIQAASETILVGWDGLTEDDGTTPIPYSPEKALELLLKPEYVDIRTFVVGHANDLASYRMGSLGN